MDEPGGDLAAQGRIRFPIHCTHSADANLQGDVIIRTREAAI